MPDLVGMSEEEAKAELVPFNVRIKTEPLISPNPVGSVIDQQPVAGSPFAQSVTLTVSVAPPPVPDVRQRTFGDAEDTLTSQGFTVREEPVFDDTLADGLVTDQSPAAGTQNASEVVLQVVRRPIVKYLSNLPEVSQPECSRSYSDCFTAGTHKANAKSYNNALRIVPIRGTVQNVEYDLSRQYRQLVGEIGLDDRSPANANAKVEVYGDGRLLKEETVPFGTTAAEDIDVTGVLRLRISVSIDVQLERSDAGGVVLGDFRLQGVPSEITTTTAMTSTSGG